VGSAGNTPVRHFQFYFVTPDLQAGNWIASREVIGLPSRSSERISRLARLRSPAADFVAAVFVHSLRSERRLVAGVGVTPT
jgi:hypothetical protein